MRGPRVDLQGGARAHHTRLTHAADFGPGPAPPGAPGGLGRDYINRLGCLPAAGSQVGDANGPGEGGPMVSVCELLRIETSVWRGRAGRRSHAGWRVGVDCEEHTGSRAGPGCDGLSGAWLASLGHRGRLPARTRRSTVSGGRFGDRQLERL